MLVFLPLVLFIDTYATDTSRVLTKDAFISIIKTYHPVVKQAKLQVDRANANVLSARGGFDPFLSANLDRKTFDGKLYYSYFKPEIVVPTWYGIEFKAGAEEIIGTRVSSESTLGQTTYMGVKAPVTGLLFDKRRAALRQAQALSELSEAECKLVVNNLLFDALSTYWNWVKEYQVYQVISNLIATNEQRLRFVRIEYEQGARPGFDTVETNAQLQTLYSMQNAAWNGFMNAGLEMSNFLWLDNDQPASWSVAVSPDSMEVAKGFDNLALPLIDTILSAIDNHPKLQAIGFKLDALEIEQRLKAQSLLPKLSLSANMLSKGYKLPGDVNIPMLENNHKLGVEFNMPLFQRDARGAYKASKLKIQETKLEQSLVTLQQENKVRSYFNELTAGQQQTRYFAQALDNYRRLYDAERFKFELGESSLFMINSREMKMLETAQKVIELKTKWHKNYSGLLWAAGILF